MYLHFALKGPEILGRPVVKKCCVIKRIYMDFPSGFFHIKTFLKHTFTHIFHKISDRTWKPSSGNDSNFRFANYLTSKLFRQRL